MKKIVRNGLSFAIILMVMSLMVTTCFAFGTIPRGDNVDYVYYGYFNLGGSVNSYTGIRQMQEDDRFPDQMIPGFETEMVLSGTKKQYRMDSTVKFKCIENLPSTRKPITEFSVKEKLMKKTGWITWEPVMFSDGTKIHNIVSKTSLPRTTASTYTYNAPYYAYTAYNQNIGEGNYQIDLVCPYIDEAYVNYYMMFYKSIIMMR